ncbi:ParA family protein [Aliikangiella maris]|uniref:ParA family protein n=2 Tax=Aliikangiella maris TaxID=3162458 RepID=A0ABV3MTR2_9GAMM
MKNKIITSAQQKGGVGKTTTLVNNAYYIQDLNASMRRTSKILLIDFDPQENLTDSVVNDEEKLNSLVDASMLFKNGFDVKNTPPIKTHIEGVELIRAGEALSDIEAADFSVITKPREYLKKLDYGYIMIDTPPSLGRLSLAALCAANFAYSPIIMDDYSISGLEKFLLTVNSIKAEYNPDLQFLGMLPNLVDSKDRAQLDKLKEAQDMWGEIIFKHHIKRSSAIPKAISEKRAIWRNPPNGNAAKVGRQVKEVSREVIKRCILSSKEEVAA